MYATSCMRVSAWITPACAGKTWLRVPSPLRCRGSPPHARGRPSTSFSSCRGNPDHPRMRGEDALLDNVVRKITGSPPHARGRLGIFITSYARDRITPACAGKTFVAVHLCEAKEDHPRMRGEDTDTPAFNEFAYGSPPHARGRPSFLSKRRRTTRITPACAGKTYKPCECDEGHFGSPPHARGRHLLKRLSGRGRRITPACAGKTGFLRWGVVEGAGSPPHARGRRMHVRERHHTMGITPACAGKTPTRK